MMTTRKLILKVIGTQSLTVGQLTAQVVVEWRITDALQREGVAPSQRSVTQSLRNLVPAGHVVTERDYDSIIRYSLPEPQYRFDNLMDAWQVWRKHPDIEGDETCIARNMSEAEARMTVAALNEMNRKVRGIKGGL